MTSGITGLAVASDSPQGQNPLIRGLKRESVALLVDGMRLDSAQPAGAIASFMSLGLVIAALLRAGSGSPLAGPASTMLVVTSGVVWIGCFVLYLAYSWRILAGPRPDDAGGCAGPA